MKCSKAAIHRKTHRIPEIKFEDQRLTSFAGLVVYQALFARIGLKQQLSKCFRHLTVSPIFGHGVVVLLLVVHLLLGYRRLQDMRYYQDDPMVRRLLGLKRLPDVATVSRTLAGLDDTGVANLRRLVRQRVLEQLGALALARITLDFDGSVLSTGRFAEGTAVGFNRKKKGQRSYYPLFCTIAQTGQVLDVWHRPGNVHDANGARDFILACVREIKALNPNTAVEALTPDFNGVREHVEIVVDSGLDVFAQNVETVERLTHPVRDPRATYEQTIAVLRHAKAHRPDVLTKTSLMLGLGEPEPLE